MHIVHISAEMAPFAKVGGLGDVAFGYCRSLAADGHKVEVFMPKYDLLSFDEIEGVEEIEGQFLSYFDGNWFQNRIWRANIDGFTVIFLEPKDPFNFFRRGTVYGEADDSERFLYFSRLALHYIHSRNHLPDVLHIHDWHTAIIPLLQKELYEQKVGTVFTIHNLAYQGVSSAESLAKIGLNFEEASVNLMELAIQHADAITTVSPTYAQEILTPENGMGLDHVLRENRDKLKGILNGIDQNFWNPEKDPLLPFHFSVEQLNLDTPPFIENKKQGQNKLRKTFGLQEKHCPIVSSITRLVYQKSPELIKKAIYWTIHHGGQFVLLGSASDKKTHEEFKRIQKEFEGSGLVHIELTYNEKLSHLVYAASDLFIVPSVYEPCGLTQMFAMRYGTVPLVRKTGGLADTVFEGKNGFVFGPLTAQAMEEAFRRAFHCWFYEPKKWATLMKEGMRTDFSWNKPQEEYLKLYKKVKPKEGFV